MDGDLALQREEDGGDLHVDARALGAVSGGVAPPLRSRHHHLVHPPHPGRSGVGHQQHQSVADTRHPLWGHTGVVTLRTTRHPLWGHTGVVTLRTTRHPLWGHTGVVTLRTTRIKKEDVPLVEFMYH